MSDEELLEELNVIDLEAKEQQLRLLNEQLDQRREQIVERAEKLLNKQESLLERYVEDNVKQSENSDSEIEGILQIDDEAQSKANDIDELPRTLIPQKLIKKRNDTFRKYQESKTPDNDTPNLNDLEMESEILNGTSIGKDAQLRLEKARYKSLEKSVANLVEISNEKEKELRDANKRIKELEMKLKKSEKEKEHLNTKLGIQKKEDLELVKKCKRLEHELYSIKIDLKQFKKEGKLKKDSMRNSHIRLNRALENAEKYKNLLTKYKNENKNSNQIHSKDLIHLKNENRILIKQKNELLSAFKKQLKLIDILKKQKIHLESAKVLQFTEKQFIKTLDIGNKI